MMTPFCPLRQAALILAGHRVGQMIAALLCCSETAQPTHLVFEHPASGNLLMFRRYRTRGSVTPANLAAVRKLLDERGLLPADEFDNRLNKAPA